MRKIVSQKEKEEAEAKKGRIIVIVISIILLFSILGYSFKGFGEENTEKKTYGDIDFELTERGWYFNVEGMNFIMQYLPEETMNISTNISLNVQDYVNQPVYFSTDSLQEGIRELEGNLYNFVFRMQYSCLSENCTEYVLKNCTNDKIIMIEESNETFISQKDNCIIIKTRLGDTVRASDRFLYQIFGFN